jgi:hypothetical protein
MRVKDQCIIRTKEEIRDQIEVGPGPDTMLESIAFLSGPGGKAQRLSAESNNARHTTPISEGKTRPIGVGKTLTGASV